VFSTFYLLAKKEKNIFYVHSLHFREGGEVCCKKRSFCEEILVVKEAFYE
jgi:hypothetical protein